MHYICYPYYQTSALRVHITKNSRQNSVTQSIHIVGGQGSNLLDQHLVSPITYTPNVHQPLKLPVWPVWSGIIAQFADWLRLPDLSEFIVNRIGGRVIPMQLSAYESLNRQSTSPFLLLVHHSHSFTPLDPFRAITRALLPEGFPAHPHSGFDTGQVTLLSHSHSIMIAPAHYIWRV